MPKKHPLYAAIEERIAQRAEHIARIEKETEALEDRRSMLLNLQDQDNALLVNASKPRKKPEKKEGTQS